MELITGLEEALAREQDIVALHQERIESIRRQLIALGSLPVQRMTE